MHAGKSLPTMLANMIFISDDSMKSTGLHTSPCIAASFVYSLIISLKTYYQKIYVSREIFTMFNKIQNVCKMKNLVKTRHSKW